MSLLIKVIFEALPPYFEPLPWQYLLRHEFGNYLKACTNTKYKSLQVSIKSFSCLAAAFRKHGGGGGGIRGLIAHMLRLKCKLGPVLVLPCQINQLSDEQLTKECLLLMIRDNYFKS